MKINSIKNSDLNISFINNQKEQKIENPKTCNSKLYTPANKILSSYNIAFCGVNSEPGKLGKDEIRTLYPRKKYVSPFNGILKIHGKEVHLKKYIDELEIGQHAKLVNTAADGKKYSVRIIKRENGFEIASLGDECYTLYAGAEKENNSKNNYSPAEIRQKAREWVSEIYERKGKADYAEKFRNGTFLPVLYRTPAYEYKYLIELIYGEIRNADYPMDSRYNEHIDKITGADTPSIKVSNENNWHYRIPKNYTGEIKERVSINAVTDERLIKALDELFTSGGVKGYYKTPAESMRWLDRHDPVTIYLNDTPDVKTLEKIKNAAQNYIRSTEDVLIGEKFAPGFALEKSPDTESIKALIKKAASVDPALGEAVLSTCTHYLYNDENGQILNPPKSILIASAGQVTAIERVLERLGLFQ